MFLEQPKKPCPYGLLNDEDIINLNTSSSMYLYDMIPVFDPNSTSSVINDLAHNDVDRNLPLSINCKYYIQMMNFPDYL